MIISAVDLIVFPWPRCICRQQPLMLADSISKQQYIVNYQSHVTELYVT